MVRGFKQWIAPALLVTLAGCGSTPAAAPSSPAAAPSSAAAKPAAAASPASASAKPAASAASGAAKPAASAGASASAAASAKPATSGLTKLTTSYSNISGSNLTLFVTKEGGYFEKNGLDVDMQFISGGAKNMAALVANQIQIGHVGGSELVSATVEGADLVSIGTLTPVFPYKFEAAPAIKTIQDLKGKPVGISTRGGAVDIATRLLLRKYGMDADKDIIPVPDNGSEFRMQGLLGGATQAAMADPPGLLQLEANGFHALADLAEEKIPTSNTAITASRAYIQGHKDVMQKYVDSLIQGTARAKKDKAFSVSVLKKYFKTDDEKGLNATYDFFALEVAPSIPNITVDQFKDSITELSAKNEKVKGFDASKVIDNSFVKNAADRGVDKSV
jgi:NitT/TauT family transport system substrate-binding protein